MGNGELRGRLAHVVAARAQLGLLGDEQLGVRRDVRRVARETARAVAHRRMWVRRASRLGLVAGAAQLVPASHEELRIPGRVRIVAGEALACGEGGMTIVPLAQALGVVARPAHLTRIRRRRRERLVAPGRRVAAVARGGQHRGVRARLHQAVELRRVWIVAAGAGRALDRIAAVRPLELGIVGAVARETLRGGLAAQQLRRLRAVGHMTCHAAVLGQNGMAHAPLERLPIVAGVTSLGTFGLQQVRGRRAVRIVTRSTLSRARERAMDVGSLETERGRRMAFEAERVPLLAQEQLGHETVAQMAGLARSVLDARMGRGQPADLAGHLAVAVEAALGRELARRRGGCATPRTDGRADEQRDGRPERDALGSSADHGSRILPGRYSAFRPAAVMMNGTILGSGLGVRSKRLTPRRRSCSTGSVRTRRSGTRAKRR
jgi:hypothetical protein